MADTYEHAPVEYTPEGCARLMRAIRELDVPETKPMTRNEKRMHDSGLIEDACRRHNERNVTTDVDDELREVPLVDGDFWRAILWPGLPLALLLWAGVWLVAALGKAVGP